MLSRVVPPAWYLPPTREEMRAAVEPYKEAIPAYAPSLLRDLACAAAGGQVKPPSVIEAEAQAASEGSDARRLAFRGQKIADFIAQIDWAKVPGDSPLEQAVNVLAALPVGHKGLDGEEGEALPLFKEGVAQEVERLFEEIETLSDVEQELVLEGESKGSPIGVQKMRDNQVLLQISRKLSALSQLKASKRKRFEPEGDEVRTRPMRSYQELSRVATRELAQYAYAPKLFKARLAQMSLSVRERGRWVMEKQALVVLIDVSGSMNGARASAAAGVLLNRIEQVLRGDAVLHVATFDSQVLREWVCDTPAAARTCWQEFKNVGFSGGGTNIAKAVARAVELADGSGHSPEILVVTDDDGSSSRIKLPAGHKLHAVVFANNPGLQEIVSSCNGVFIRESL